MTSVAGVATLVSAALLLVTAVTHSVLGERLILGPLLAQRGGMFKSELARMLVRFTWHLTSLSWLVLVVILAASVASPGGTTRAALAATGIVFTSAGLYDVIASRGRHLGWPLLMGAGIAALAALAFTQWGS